MFTPRRREKWLDVIVTVASVEAKGISQKVLLCSWGHLFIRKKSMLLERLNGSHRFFIRSPLLAHPDKYVEKNDISTRQTYQTAIRWFKARYLSLNRHYTVEQTKTKMDYQETILHKSYSASHVKANALTLWFILYIRLLANNLIN